MKVRVSRTKKVKIDEKVVGEIIGCRFPAEYRVKTGQSNDFQIKFGEEENTRYLKVDLPYYLDVVKWIKNNPQQIFEESRK